MKTHRLILLAVLAALLLLVSTGPALAAPALDGGEFPTSTPTATPLPTETPVPSITPLTVVLTLEIPTATSTLLSLDPGQSSNIQETTDPAEPRANPLVPLGYIILFIFLLVGVWMLFSRRGMNP